MTVRVSHQTALPVQAPTYWRDIWLNMTFLKQLYAQLGFEGVELISQDGDHERGMKRHMRLRRPINAPVAVQKVLGSPVIMDEYSEFDPKAQRWTYRMVTEKLGERLDVTGSIALVDHAQGVEELSEDNITLRVFGVGSLVEPFIARESKQSHADRLAFTQRYIAEQQLR